ncbi:MAG: triose-phosphate isomerase [Patescibacteria group bacterium]
MKKYIFGNWKMYLNNEESVVYAEELKKKSFKDKNLEIAFFPTALSLISVYKVLKKILFH